MQDTGQPDQQISWRRAFMRCHQRSAHALPCKAGSLYGKIGPIQHRTHLDGD
jgi:hypothetical protein